MGLPGIGQSQARPRGNPKNEVRVCAFDDENSVPCITRGPSDRRGRVCKQSLHLSLLPSHSLALSHSRIGNADRPALGQTLYLLT
jgi:hypothetical protein